jgi:uncharacterized protein YecE (DUF72 family)
MLRIGTCSWKYSSWRGLVYSDKIPPNYLKEYAQRYNTVEIDQWFWSLHGVDSVTLPQPRVVREYLDSVPSTFTFSIKIPNSITLTHLYRNKKDAPLVSNPHFLSLELFQNFLTRIEPLKEHLGPLMFQFEYLNKQKMPSQKTFQDRFKEFVKKCPQSYQYAVEIRNPNYLNESYFTFLRENTLWHVFLQGYYMPPIFQVYEKFHSFLEKGTVIRLHGPDRKGMEEKSSGRWDTIVESKDEELPDIIRMIRDLESRNVDIYVNVNNHFEGSAPLTIDKIREGLSGHINLNTVL